MPLPRFQDTSRPWDARWIWHPEATRDGYAHVLFRHEFDLPAALDQTTLWVSADERFVLYLDGRLVARGPTRSDLTRWVCTRVQTGPLSAGRHLLAVAAFHGGPDHAGMGQLGIRGGFLLRGEGPGDFDARVRTDKRWFSFHDASRTPLPPHWGDVRAYHCTGSGERIDGAAHPWGWETRGFDAAGWVAARECGAGEPAGMRNAATPYWLIPDPLPPLDEEAQRFARVAEAEGLDAKALDAWLAEDFRIEIPANKNVRILLDRGELTNAYTRLTVSGGRGATIRSVSVEAMFVDGSMRKDDRNATAGKHAWGQVDEFLADGGASRSFEAFWWRSFRFVELTIRTAGEPLMLERVRATFTGYPLREAASFTPDETHRARFARMQDLSWRTARLCAHETYFDCPHYEQLQYVGDTRIQALFSYLVAGDDRLGRKAIDDFWASRIPEGLTQSRFPSRLPQMIPTFSLYWIGMLFDSWRYRGDTAFLAPYLPAARDVLEWFAARRRGDGMPGALPFWNFGDWVPGWKMGEPPGTEHGGSAFVALLCAQAARWMERLEYAFGLPELCPRWRKLADTLRADTLRTCWVESRGMLADTPERISFSQHVNVQGILEGALDRFKPRAVLETVLGDPGVTAPGSPYFRYYVAQAYKAVNWRTGFFDLLARWDELLDGTGLTTWPESDGWTRSDCHAWSCTPSLEFLQTVLGVEPELEAAGLSRLLITPCLGPLREAAGDVPLPQGNFKIQLARIDSKYARVQIESPVPGRIVEEATGRSHPFDEGRSECEALIP
ncbi:MAG: hypothetical protein AMXMBFR7_07040 [Planctomycetota bacterium]